MISSLLENEFSKPPLYPHLDVLPFRKNPYEYSLSDQYSCAQQVGGLKTPVGWTALLGEENKFKPITIIMPAYQEPDAGLYITSLLGTLNRPDSVPVDFILVLDGHDEKTRASTHSVLHEMLARQYKEDRKTGMTNLSLPFLEGLAQRIESNRNRACWNNITYTVLEKDHSGKISTLKAGTEMSDTDFAVYVDADVILHPDAIPLVHAALLKFPELKLATGVDYPIYDSSNRIARGRDAFMVPSLSVHRVHGQLMGIRSEMMSRLPDVCIREDYFLEQYLEKQKQPWACIQEAEVYSLSQDSYTEISQVKSRMERGEKQVRNALGLDELSHPSYTGILPSESEIRRLGHIFRDPIPGVLFLSVKGISAIEDRMSHIIDHNHNEKGDWEPNKQTKVFNRIRS